MDARVYITALRKCPGVGNKALNNLLDFFDDAAIAWHSLTNYADEIKWTDKQLEAFINHRKNTSLKNIEDRLVKDKIQVITIKDKEYPAQLREIHNPPTVLFVRGKIPNAALTMGIVGSRRPTAYGKVIAEKLAEELAAQDVLIVSGLARGIDTFAHKGALRKGLTVAVLGCGVDIIYPRENSTLFNEIISSGSVISEFPPGSPPEAGHFPARNRIISGLSQGIVVVEAAQKSGSLITADFALEQGRDVFAVPGPITSNNSVGCHYLIKNGAKLVTDTEDILEEYNYIVGQHTSKEGYLKNISKEERAIIEILDYQPRHFEEILMTTKIDIGTLSKILTRLEIKKDIRQLPGQYYVIDKVNMG